MGTGAYLGTVGASLFIQLCTALQGIILARVLGPVGRGELAAVVLWPMWFAGVGIGGVDVALARAAGRSADLSGLRRTALTLAALTSLATAGTAYFLLPYLFPVSQQQLQPVSALFLAVIPLNHAALTLQAVEQGAGQFTLLNLSKVSLNPVYLSALVVFWLLGTTSLRWVIAALLASNGVVLVILLAARGRGLLRQHHLERPWSLIREGSHYALVNIGNLLHQRVDQALLLWLLPTHDLGLYVVALSAGSVVGSVTGSISIVSFAEAAQANPHEGFERIAKAVRRATILCIVLSVALVPALPWLVPAVYGRAFAGATPVATVIVFGSMAVGLAQILDQSLRGQGRPYAGLVGRAAAIAVMSVGGLLITPILGLMGMAVGYLASQVAYLVVLGYSVLRHYDGGAVASFLPTSGDVGDLWKSGKTVFGRLGHGPTN
jgi:O-antigen/teichoic acid export membrane protein